jgi:hypothetical protein
MRIVRRLLIPASLARYDTPGQLANHHPLDVSQVKHCALVVPVIE